MDCGAQPVPVVLDTHLRMPLTCRLALTARERHPIIFYCAESADPVAMKKLVAAGFRVLSCPRDSGGRLDVRHVRDALTRLGLRRLMVEGGVAVLESFLCSGVYDAICATVAPKIVRGRGLFTGPFGESDDGIRGELPLTPMHQQSIGGDSWFIYLANENKVHA